MDFEKAFEEIMGQEEYDRAEEALFQIVRAAFKGGWRAARRVDNYHLRDVDDEKRFYWPYEADKQETNK